jgi:hypothetical protein
MNSEVVKNFKLERRKEHLDTGKAASEVYIFKCRNCQKQINIEESIRGSKIIDPLRVNFDLSVHLMQCEFYDRKLENERNNE